jgi:aminoglycoside phosphotransferase (APT) family kinase protein
MGAQNMPEAEVDLSPDVVRSLLINQHPDLADLEIEELANGWDNVIYRLGSELTVRTPRREMAAVLVENEQRWLPTFVERLPIAIPAPVRIGRPAAGYPWAWSINPWFDGEVACESPLTDPTAEAQRLGEFLAALHVPAPENAPLNPYRGHFVGLNTPVFLDRVEVIAAELEALVPGGAAATRLRWAELTDVEPFESAPVWLHADLHTANVLVTAGRISAVVDFGDICAGDPANDLAIAWMMFDESERAAFHASASAGESGVDDAMWQRGAAWALHFAIIYLMASADNARMHAIGERLIAAVI